MPGTLTSDAVQCKKDLEELITKLKAVNPAQHSDKTKEIDQDGSKVSDQDFFHALGKDVIDWLFANVPLLKEAMDALVMNEAKADKIVHDWSDVSPKALSDQASQLMSLDKQISSDWVSGPVAGLNFDSLTLEGLNGQYGQLQDKGAGLPQGTDHTTWFAVRQATIGAVLTAISGTCVAVGELVNKVNDLIKKLIKWIKEKLADWLVKAVDRILTVMAEKIPGAGWLMEGIDVICNHSDALTRLIADITDTVKKLMEYKDAVWDAIKEADSIVRSGEKVFKDVGNLLSHFK